MAKPKARERIDPDGRKRIAIEATGTFGRIKSIMAARPGSFEWRAARRMWTDAQEQAGRKARSLWEACGHAGPASVDLAMLVAGSSRKASHGPQEAALESMQQSGLLGRAIGMIPEARLRAYLLTDLTVAEMAHRWTYPVRDMTAVLRADLDAAAAYFGYDPRG